MKMDDVFAESRMWQATTSTSIMPALCVVTPSGRASYRELLPGASARIVPVCRGNMKRFIAFVLLSVAAINSNAADEVIVTKYNRSCISCHASGAANAPRTGDAVAWKPRLAKGIDTLVAHVNKGFNAMPPKGLCGDCSDADYKALIEYMSKAK